MVSDEIIEKATNTFQHVRWFEAFSNRPTPTSRDAMRAALEAVYPIIRAQVIEECARVCDGIRGSAASDCALAICALESAFTKPGEP